MVTTVQSAALIGVAAHIISVEAQITQGLSTFTIVGLPDARVQEARERVRAAIKQSGYAFPYNFRITINLAPADVRKEGTGFDLPIALAVLSKTIEFTNLEKTVVLGELALDGTLRSVRGVLPATLAAKEYGAQAVIVPYEAAAEAALVPGITVYGARTLTDAVNHATGAHLISPTHHTESAAWSSPADTDFSSIAGNAFAKRALEIAAVGNHSVILQGPPGVGKTMLAQALAGILPALSEHERMEITQIYSSAGLELLHERPFRNPHHTASAAALIGGGRFCRPGEMTLAHRGVLFMDELPEFNRAVLQQLRQPLEEGVVRVARAEQSLTFPANFLFIAAQNPCPCGYATDPHHACTCTPRERARYAQKISGPLLDRIDLFCEIDHVSPAELSQSGAYGETTTQIRERVARAYAFAQSRRNEPPLSPASERYLLNAAEILKLSARGYTRAKCVSRSIADLAQSDTIKPEHIAEALQYRFSERT